MDAVECRSGDAAKKGAAFVFDRRANKVVNIDVDPVSGTIGLAALGGFSWVHVLFEAMGGELDFVGDKALDDIATCSGCGTEVGWTLCPAHLEGRWDNNANRVSWRIRHDVGKISYAGFRTSIRQNPSERSILDSITTSSASKPLRRMRTLRKTLPISRTSASGAMRVVVVLFTPGWSGCGWELARVLRSRYTGKDRSRISRPLRSFCGTTASGEILRLDGRSFWTSDQSIM
jgi:hypothetical protein